MKYIEFVSGPTFRYNKRSCSALWRHLPVPYTPGGTLDKPQVVRLTVGNSSKCCIGFCNIVSRISALCLMCIVCQHVAMLLVEDVIVCCESLSCYEWSQECMPSVQLVQRYGRICWVHTTCGIYYHFLFSLYPFPLPTMPFVSFPV